MFSFYRTPINVAHNDFAEWRVQDALPKIFRDVAQHNPTFPASTRDALERTAEAIATDAPIPNVISPHTPRPGDATWRMVLAEQANAVQSFSWLKCDWLFTETYAYRAMMHDIRWYERQWDPFSHKKQAALNDDDTWALLDHELTQSGDDAQRLAHHLLAAAWGNSADASFEDREVDMGADKLVVDEREATLAHITASTGETVIIVTDNTGTELLMDLLLADTLLESGSGRVILHQKYHPTYVSDATIADSWHHIQAMGEQSTPIKALGQRLIDYWAAGRIRFVADAFYNSPLFIWEKPHHIEMAYRQAALIIFKGDANYRRVVGDALWDDKYDLTDIIRSLPTPVLMLRVLKSDPIVGMAPGLRRRLNRQDEDWMLDGRYAMLQFARPPYDDQL